MPPTHYVNNSLFSAAPSEWTNARRAVIAGNQPPPPMPEFVGECVRLIAKRNATRSNYAGYLFNDDIIADACLVAVRYFHNFDASRSSNGFAYTTQLVNHAFIARIEDEKRDMHKKEVLRRTAKPSV